MAALTETIRNAADLVPDKIRNTAFLRLWALTKVPMLNWIRPVVLQLDEHKVIIKVPLNWRTKNHLGSMYFGVLACGADAAGGIIAIKLTQDSGEKIPVVFKSLKAEFLKRSEGDTIFTCDDGPKIKDMIGRAKQTGERITESVQVIATCPDKLGDEPVAKFELELSLKKK